MAEREEAAPKPVGARGPEVGVALFLAALAVLVIVDSVRAGVGWGDDGPRSGYFPFGIGCILLGASLWTLVRTLLAWRERAGEPFSDRTALAGVWAVLWPTTAYVATMALVGLYVASVLLIAFFMRRHGRYGWFAALLVGVAVPVAFFLVFEKWFLVPLPKGPFEAALGF